jgi:hypothetical protein
LIFLILKFAIHLTFEFQNLDLKSFGKSLSIAS